MWFFMGNHQENQVNTDLYKQKIQKLIYLIDEKINKQVNIILHHPLLQRLEAS